MSSDEEELFELEIDNDDDDDDAFDFHAFEMLTNANATKRKRKYPHSRIDWTKHVEERMHKEDFQSGRCGHVLVDQHSIWLCSNNKGRKEGMK